jgi:ribosomal protein S7
MARQARIIIPGQAMHVMVRGNNRETIFFSDVDRRQDLEWLREAAKKRGEKAMNLRLAGELLEAAEGRGGAVKKRDEVHRMAEANKAFSHFRF